jgi:hypothetical protein
MKFIAQFLLIIVGSYFAQLYLPWWSMVIVAGLAGLLFAFEKSRKSFYTGFFAILISWIALAFFADTLNEGIFSQKMSTVLEGLTKPVLILLPAILGGILAGFASMTGNLLRNLFLKIEDDRMVVNDSGVEVS